MVDLKDKKFKANGDFAEFRGNTVVANLYNNEEVMEVVEMIQSEYRKFPFIDKFTLTPPQSIHMTVHELLCDQNRQKDYWSDHLDLDVPIDETTEYFAKQLDVFPLVDEDITMEVEKMGITNLVVNPADEASDERLKEIREYISKQTGTRFPNHDSYQFHISTGYLREELTDEEQKIFKKVRNKMTELLHEKLPTIDIERIDFTRFDDMTEFIPYGDK